MKCFSHFNSIQDDKYYQILELAGLFVGLCNDGTLRVELQSYHNQ